MAHIAVLAGKRNVVLWAAETILSAENALVGLCRAFLRFDHIPAVPARIVVSRVGNIGDIVTAVPALAALRKQFPDARISLLTSPGGAALPGAREVLEGSRLFDELIWYLPADLAEPRELVRFVKRVRDWKPDLYVLLTHDVMSFSTVLKNVVFARAIGVRAFVGGEIERRPFGHRLRDQAGASRHDAIRTLECLRGLGTEWSEPLEFDLPSIEHARAAARDLLGALQKPIVAIAPGGKREINRWPAERFAEVARRIVWKYGASIVVIGGGEDAGRAEVIQEACPSAKSLLGQPFPVVIEALRQCAVTITNDTGGMHLASAVGSRVIAVFSSRDFRGKWYPYGKENIVLRTEPGCSICFLESCPTMHCNRDITCDQVFDAFEAVLGGRPTGREDAVS